MILVVYIADIVLTSDNDTAITEIKDYFSALLILKNGATPLFSTD